MKRILIFVFLLFVAKLEAQINFDDYFLPKTLRIDYIHIITPDTSLTSLQQMREEPYWAGTRKNLIDPFGYGNYRIEVFDSASSKLIYTNGYSSLSAEWRFMAEGNPGYPAKSFYESVSIPYPKQTVRFVLSFRDKQLKMHRILDFYVSPDDIYISHEEGEKYNVQELMINGDMQNKVDLLILPEGYTQAEMDKFLSDAQRIMDVLFSYEPFSDYKGKFNVRAVLSASEESGTDNPGKDVWRNTILNSHFYTFGISRYLTTEDYKSVKDVASVAPYDQIIVLVNTETYGGGGFYNFLNLTAAGNRASGPIFVHEFGHAFAGLADEYVDNDIEDFYEKSLEPWEPNITTLVNFDDKWVGMVSDTVPIPTPVTQAYQDVVGVFEGAGYSPEGIYRPQQKCLMRQLDAPFCKVCDSVIIQVINYYTK